MMNAELRRSVPLLVILLTKFGGKFLGVLAKFSSAKVALGAASAATYTLLFTWQFAAMIMTMLFVHEYGHIWAMKRIGMRVKGIYFIPFFGGAAVADEEFPSRQAEAFIAIMGPVFGLGISALTGVAYFLTHNPLFAAGASWMALVNLFNLLPIHPLDGGRIFKSVAFSFNSSFGWFVVVGGLLLAGVLAFKMESMFIAVIIAIGGAELYSAYKNKDRYELPRMTVPQISQTIGAYLGLAAILFGLMMLMDHVPGAAAAMNALRG